MLCVTVWEVPDCLGLHPPPLAFAVLVMLVLDMEALLEVKVLGCLGLHPLAFMVAAPLEEGGLLIELLGCFGGGTDSPLFADVTFIEGEEKLATTLGCLELRPPP